MEEKQPRMTEVMMLKNYAPKPGIVDASLLDELGRLMRDSVVSLPVKMANDLVKAKIASRDAAIEGED